MTATLLWNRGILKMRFKFELSFWLWKSMNYKLRKSANVAQTKLSLILVILASLLIFSIKIRKFVLYEKLIKMGGQ